MNPKTAPSTKDKDWPRLLLWTPLLIGGIVLALLAPRGLRLRRALRRLGFDSRSDAQTREHLRLAIIGNDKQTIAAVFGPPRATALGRAVRPGAASDAGATGAANDAGATGAANDAGATGAAGAPDWHHFAADTWYYLFDPAQHSAVVIEFDRGVARQAEFIQSPARLAASEE